MSQRFAVFFITVIGILSSAGLAVVVMNYLPRTAPGYVLWAFFLSVFGLGTTLGTLIWHIIKRAIFYRLYRPSVWVSFRQAALASGLAVTGFFFNSLGIFRVWDMVPLTIAALLIEFFFQADKTDPTRLV
jgi:hypothetical protein